MHFQVKNNRLDKDLISKQINALYPPDIKEPVTKSVEKCISIRKYNSKVQQ